MAVALGWLGAYTAAASAASHTLAIAWGGGSGVVAVGVSMEASQSISGVTCNGTQMELATSISHTTTPNSKLGLYTSAFSAASANYDVVVTLSASSSDISFGVWRVDNANATLHATATSESGTGTATVSTTIAAVSNGAVLALVQSGGATVTWDTYAGVSEREELNETNYTSAFADALTTNTEARTVSATASSTSGNKVLGVLSFSPESPSTPAFSRYRVAGAVR